VGLTLKHTRGHLVRAIMEGVVYALNDSLSIMRDLGVPVRQIRVGGGGAKSALWRQIQADVFGQKVHRINAEQGPAYGVALLAAVGARAFRNIQEACTATICTIDETSVQRAARQVYAHGFPQFQQLYRSLRDDFQRIAALA
jgi:xylulokinase